MPSSVMAHSPSKIPVMKTRACPPDAPRHTPPSFVSRIPKAVSHEGREKVEDDPDFDKSGKSSAFVRRISPPAFTGPTRNDGEDERTWTQQFQGQWTEASDPVTVDIEPQLLLKVQQTRRNSDSSLNKCGLLRSPRKSSTSGSPSRIPIANDHVTNKSRSSSCSAESAASSTRASPVRQVSPLRRISPSAREKTFSKSSEQLVLPAPDSPAVDREEESEVRVHAKDSMHLDLGGSKIPMPKNRRYSPGKAMPTLGWSFSPERMLGEGSKSTSVPTSQLQSKLESDNDNSNEAPANARKFEAFMMTGDRMIKLAKTPANQEFKSKYPKLTSDFETTNVSSAVDELPEEGGLGSEVVQKREHVASRRALVRNSKSEDQLNFDDQISPPENCLGSVDTLLNTSGIDYLENGNDEVASSPLHQKQRSPAKEKPAFELMSPEVDSYSLISCSEHYNAGSVLDNKMMSPNSSISSGTPEWSLMDSFHKKNGHISSVMEASKEEDFLPNQGIQFAPNGDKVLHNELIKSPTGKIGNPLSKLENEFGEQRLLPLKLTSPPNPNHSILTNSSEEDSDLDSLRSYHPPVKVVDVPSAVRLAKRLFHMDGFKKTDVARHLSKNTDYNHVVAEEYLKYFDFCSCSLDQALRKFLSHFCLTGETQERERVLLHFSRRFLESNPEVLGRLFGSQDAVHTLTCAIMLLNTDLHGDGLSRKMSCLEFIENLSDLNDGADFPSDLLKNIYAAIKTNPIPWAAAAEATSIREPLELPQQQTQLPHRQDIEVKTSGTAITIGQAAGGINPFLTLPDSSQSIDFKNGYVMRKACFDANGKRTKLGKRSWRMFFLTLRDMVLYCFKDEKTVRMPGAFEDLNSAIRIHHGLAVRAADYTKKQFVFRLHTSDQAQYLFQTSDEKELLTWIDVINYVVASFSSPQLPAPVSSGARFQRPLMPSAKTRLTPDEQLAAHEGQLMQLRAEIEHHLQHPPSRGSKQIAIAAFREKTESLKFEIMRYDTYILTLRTKNSHDRV